MTQTPEDALIEYSHDLADKAVDSVMEELPDDCDPACVVHGMWCNLAYMPIDAGWTGSELKAEISNMEACAETGEIVQ